MRWSDLNDHTNGMRDVLIIIILEWLVLLPVAYYFDHASSVGHRSSLLSIIKHLLKDPTSRRITVNKIADKDVHIEMEKLDIIKEVSSLLHSYCFPLKISHLPVLFRCTFKFSDLPIELLFLYLPLL
jgi:hypothetical protein